MGEMRLEKKVNALTLGFFVVLDSKITLQFLLYVADYFHVTADKLKAIAMNFISFNTFSYRQFSYMYMRFIFLKYILSFIFF